MSVNHISQYLCGSESDVPSTNRTCIQYEAEDELKYLPLMHRPWPLQSPGHTCSSICSSTDFPPCNKLFSCSELFRSAWLLQLYITVRMAAKVAVVSPVAFVEESIRYKYHQTVQPLSLSEGAKRRIVYYTMYHSNSAILLIYNDCTEWRHVKFGH